MADITGHEATANPDGGELDSNPYDVLDTAAGLYVADAGGNDLLAVDGAGMVSTHTVFPTQMAEFPPGSGNMFPAESVPTTIATDPAGNLRVGELTGFPFVIGAARVYDVTTPGNPQVAATGFTMIGDIDYDSQGNLYVLEIFANGETSEDPTGALYRIAPDGTRTALVDAPCTMAPPDPMAQALCLPTGMAVGPDDMVYVVNYGLMGPLANLVRIDPSAPTAVQLDTLAVGGSDAGSLALSLLAFALAAALLMGLRARRPA